MTTLFCLQPKSDFCVCSFPYHWNDFWLWYYVQKLIWPLYLIFALLVTKLWSWPALCFHCFRENRRHGTAERTDGQTDAMQHLIPCAFSREGRITSVSPQWAETTSLRRQQETCFVMGSHWYTSTSTGFSSQVSNRCTNCKHWYIMWTLRYVRHNRDIIIDVKTFWRPFLLFSWRKRGNIHSYCSYFKVIHTRIQKFVNVCYWNTSKLVFTITRTRGYQNSYSYQCEPGLTAAPSAESKLIVDVSDKQTDVHRLKVKVKVEHLI